MPTDPQAFDYEQAERVLDKNVMWFDGVSEEHWEDLRAHFSAALAQPAAQAGEQPAGWLKRELAEASARVRSWPPEIRAAYSNILIGYDADGNPVSTQPAERGGLAEGQE